MGKAPYDQWEQGGAPSPWMHHAQRLCRLYARVDRPILFLGPVGAGKTTLAAKTHQFSGRQGRLVVVSAGELTEGLYSDTLFGHVKGAFTGASGGRLGVIDHATGGTLLLDDLAVMPIVAQAAILRVVESRSFRPLGSAESRTARCRFMFASTAPVGDLIASRVLLPDLGSRLGELVVPVPGLADRPEDIMPLASRFASRFLDEMGVAADASWTDEARDLLLDYPWPRNARELRGVTERALIHAGLTPGAIEVRPGHLPDRFHKSHHDAAPGQPHLTRSLVESVLSQVGGNQSEAARRLGVHRNTVARYLRTGS